MWRRTLLALALSCGVGCSLIVPVGDLSSQAGAPSPGAIEDAGEDVPLLPSFPPAQQPDGGVFVPCRDRTPPPIFCDDFDGESSLTEQWANRYVTGGTLIRDDSDGITKPRSLRAELPLSSKGSTRYVYVQQTFSGLPKRLAYEFDMTLLTVPSSGPSVPLNRFTVGNLSLVLSIGRGGSSSIGTRVDRPPAESYYNGTDLPDLGVGVWRHVVITADVGSDPATFSVAYDGKVVVDRQAVAVPVPEKNNAAIMAGIFYAEVGDGPLAVRIDNAVLTAP